MLLLLSMEKSIQQLESIIDNYALHLNSLTEDEWMHRPDAAKWSKKEVLGHLIDSAQNNIRRFVVARYEDKPKIIYAQDSWVTAANYQNYLTTDLISLWGLLNKHMCVVLKNVPKVVEENLCDDLIMGDGTSVKIGNLLRNVKEDKLELQSGIYRKGKVNFEKEPG